MWTSEFSLHIRIEVQDGSRVVIGLDTHHEQDQQHFGCYLQTNNKHAFRSAEYGGDCGEVSR
jgi:hypothetical protein